MISISVKTKGIDFNKLPHRLDVGIKKAVKDGIEFTDRSLQEVARTDTGEMRGEIRHEMIDDKKGRIMLGAKYTKHVDKRYGFSPVNTPTGLSMVPQTHKANKGATLKEIVEKEITPAIMKRASIIIDREVTK